MYVRLCLLGVVFIIAAIIPAFLIAVITGEKLAFPIALGITGTVMWLLPMHWLRNIAARIVERHGPTKSA
jgi:Mg2+/Co2+ transporter CorB